MARYVAYGFRNSLGVEVDPARGDAWMTHNGDLAHDEVERIVPGLNCGWASLMGRGDPETVPLFDMPEADRLLLALILVAVAGLAARPRVRRSAR